MDSQEKGLFIPPNLDTRRVRFSNSRGSTLIPLSSLLVLLCIGLISALEPVCYDSGWFGENIYCQNINSESLCNDISSMGLNLCYWNNTCNSYWSNTTYALCGELDNPNISICTYYPEPICLCPENYTLNLTINKCNLITIPDENITIPDETNVTNVTIEPIVEPEHSYSGYNPVYKPKVINLSNDTGIIPVEKDNVTEIVNETIVPVDIVKVPIYKKWWFYGIIVLIGIIIYFIFKGNESQGM